MITTSPSSLNLRQARVQPAHQPASERANLSTLLLLAWPNVLVMVAQASTGLIETWFISRLGTDALAGMALVFPGVMLMQMIPQAPWAAVSHRRSRGRSAPDAATTRTLSFCTR